MKYKDIHSLAKHTELSINGIKTTLDSIHPFVIRREAHSPNNQFMTDNDVKIIQNMFANLAKEENEELTELIDEYVRITQSEL